MDAERGSIIERFLRRPRDFVWIELSTAYAAFQIKDYSEDGPYRALHIQQGAIIRREAGTTIDKDGVHRKHYIYAYEKPDPQTPNVRKGIEANNNHIRFYTVTLTEKGERINYGHIPSPQEAEFFLRDMPRGPGNLVGHSGIS